jgi:hypothetical protein
VKIKKGDQNAMADLRAAMDRRRFAALTPRDKMINALRGVGHLRMTEGLYRNALRGAVNMYARSAPHLRIDTPEKEQMLFEALIRDLPGNNLVQREGDRYLTRIEWTGDHYKVNGSRLSPWLILKIAAIAHAATPPSERDGFAGGD